MIFFYLKGADFLIILFLGQIEFKRPSSSQMFQKPTSSKQSTKVSSFSFVLCSLSVVISDVVDQPRRSHSANRTERPKTTPRLSGSGGKDELNVSCIY